MAVCVWGGARKYVCMCMVVCINVGEYVASCMAVLRVCVFVRVCMDM